MLSDEDEESLKNRLVHWEAQMKRCCECIIVLRTEQHIMKAEIVLNNAWTNWIRRVKEWFGNCMRNFPWN